MELTNKVALVTGGGTGLGREICLLLAESGMDVAVNYSRSAADAEDTAAAVRARGRRAMAVQGDVADAAQVNAMVKAVADELGRIDVLVANAGTTKFCAMANLDGLEKEDWDRILSVNVTGTWLCARAVAPYMKAQGAGRIITVSSSAGIRVAGSSMAYAVSKAGIIHLTRCLAVALAPEVTVNSVAPGLLDTRWAAGFSAEHWEKTRQRTPIKRIATLADVARQVLALVESDSITGQVVAIDSGISLV